jgi:hypothetical protein
MIVIDVETTGERAWLHSILSIGAVDFSKPKNQFYKECRIREGAEIDPVALQINGFSMDEIKSEKKDSLKDILEQFIEWSGKIEDTTMAGHNHYMDVDFIEYSLAIYGIKSPFAYRLVDTHKLTYANYISRGIKPPIEKGGSGINSTVFIKYCGLPEEPKPHNALTGAKIETEAISRLMYGKNLLEEYESFSVPEYLKR